MDRIPLENQRIALGEQQTADREHLSYFIDEVKVLSEEMQTLCFCIIQKTDKHSAENNLAKILFKMLSDLRDDSITESENLEAKERAA